MYHAQLCLYLYCYKLLTILPGFMAQHGMHGTWQLLQCVALRKTLFLFTAQVTVGASHGQNTYGKD
jgi:hypothetical protein